MASRARSRAGHGDTSPLANAAGDTGRPCPPRAEENADSSSLLLAPGDPHIRSFSFLPVCFPEETRRRLATRPHLGSPASPRSPCLPVMADDEENAVSFELKVVCTLMVAR